MEQDSRVEAWIGIKEKLSEVLEYLKLDLEDYPSMENISRKSPDYALYIAIENYLERHT